jgi:hypothetical protein
LSMDECYRFYAYDYLDLLGEWTQWSKQSTIALMML